MSGVVEVSGVVVGSGGEWGVVECVAYAYTARKDSGIGKLLMKAKAIHFPLKNLF